MPVPAGARERILAAAYELFAHRAIRDVGIAELISRAGIARATFYGHFASKEELVFSFLERCHQDRTVGQIITATKGMADNPIDRLLAIFDVLDGWFHRDYFRACAFVSTMLEMGPTHPLGQASVSYLAQIRTFIRTLAAEAGLDQPDIFARSCHILTKGSIISAVEGDTEGAVWAKRMAVSLSSDHGGGAALSSSSSPLIHKASPLRRLNSAIAGVPVGPTVKKGGRTKDGNLGLRAFHPRLHCHRPRGGPRAHRG
ncbi:TetR/AcrR family transcriptional regulator [Pseudarthrobacter sulfonivorans]|uniref:TetR/AcrR family transcriptional regulator n=1 Tax=Pseudarthrobacter sulfonivorans TaxID=121292 RepID=UPI0027D778B6|nr:TetR/AcrR family transcriptional regulator [Pseudarthrobacter sulfonivorans]